MTSSDYAVHEPAPAASGPPPSPRRDASLELLFEERSQEVIDLLSRRWWRRRRPWDAERRNNLSRVLADLGDARRLDAAHRLPEGARAHLRTVLRRRVGELSFDGILDLRDEIRKALIPIGDDAYIHALLEEERARQVERDATGRSSTLVWRELYRADPEVDELAADRLLAFSAARREQYRGDRKRVRLRQHAMLLLAPVLGALTLVAALTSAWLIDEPEAGRTVALVVVSGALGAILGSVRPLSDELRDGGDLRAYLPMLVIEPLLGAVAGLLLLLIGETGVLGSTLSDGDVWARAALLAFAAGFVEPLVLRAVSRIAGIPGDDLGPRPRRQRTAGDADQPPGREAPPSSRPSARFNRRRDPAAAEPGPAPGAVAASRADLHGEAPSG